MVNLCLRLVVSEVPWMALVPTSSDGDVIAGDKKLVTFGAYSSAQLIGFQFLDSLSSLKMYRDVHF
ncbi:MAG: hypothetical protein ACTTH7_08975 [Treponema sp.]